MKNILIVDDHVLFRQGLVSLLDAQSDFNVIGQAGSVGEAIPQIKELEPDLVLMDFSLPDGTGLDVTQAVVDDQPETIIIFLTVHLDDDRLFAAIRAGARGYLSKNVPVSELLTFLKEIEYKKTAFTPDTISRIVDEFARSESSVQLEDSGIEVLTSRELEVLRELSTDASNRQIAERLYISEHTVKNHVKNILSKLNCQNRRAAARFARSQRLY